MDCFRHLDRRRVLRGICLVKSKTKRCSEHSECSTDLKCVAGYCGDPQYFEEIKQFSCEGDNFCEDLLLGDNCCTDLTALSFETALDPRKRCCSNSSKVIVPSGDVSDDETSLVKIALTNLQEGLENVCHEFKQITMEMIQSCSQFTTMTTTTSTTTTTTTTTTATSATTTATIKPPTLPLKYNRFNIFFLYKHLLSGQ